MSGIVNPSYQGDSNYSENKGKEQEQYNDVNLPEKLDQKSTSWFRRQDVWVWLSGLVFCGVLIAAIEVAGHLRDWDAQSGHTHNESKTSQERFLPEPYTPEEGVRGRYGPEPTARWYYWQVKPDMRTFWTHFFPWIAYLGHQILIWATIYYGQIQKAKEALGPGRYSTKLSGFNWVAFGLNILFHVLHFINTHTTYDATAPDVSISTSQGSVIMLLVFVVIIEYKERGIFFGWPTTSQKDKVSQKLRFDYSPINLVRRYHGYAFAWAAIYTFWYHPMENTWGHNLGFIYTWIIMLQGSLMYTEFHLNKYWRLFLEMFVIIHAGVVAGLTGGPDMKGTTLWPMFTFGFAMCFVLTQIFSLPFWERIPTLCRFIPLILYAAIVIWAYSWIPDKEGKTWVRMPEVLRIPGVYYLFFIAGWVLIFAFLKIEKRCVKKTSIAITKVNSGEMSCTKQVLLLSGAMLMYGIHVGLAITAQLADWQLGLIPLMIVFVAVFMLGCSISFMFLRHAVPLQLIKGGEYQKDSLEKTEIKDNSKL